MPVVVKSAVFGSRHLHVARLFAVASSVSVKKKTTKRLVVELNPQYIAASRIVWQYPGAGWNCSLVGSTLNVNPGVGVRGRLVALKSDDDRNDVQGPQCQPRQINPYMPLYHSK